MRSWTALGCPDGAREPIVGCWGRGFRLVSDPLLPHASFTHASQFLFGSGSSAPFSSQCCPRHPMAESCCTASQAPIGVNLAAA